MAGRRVFVAMSVGPYSTDCDLSLSDLTAALWTAVTHEMATEELLSGPAPKLAALVLRCALGIGGVDLAHVAEDFAMAAWSEQVTAEELALWNRCAALVEELFGPSARVAGADVKRSGGGELS